MAVARAGEAAVFGCAGFTLDKDIQPKWRYGLKQSAQNL